MTITIRHADSGDVKAICCLYAQPHAVNGTLQQPYPALSVWEKRFESWGDNIRSLLAEVDGQLAGHLGLMLESNLRRKHVASIGMGVDQQFLHQGVGRALVGAAIDLCDNWLNISRMELEVFTDNEAAIGLYRNSGFEIEGTLRQFAFRAGQYEDVYAMARLKP